MNVVSRSLSLLQRAYLIAKQSSTLCVDPYLATILYGLRYIAMQYIECNELLLSSYTRLSGYIHLEARGKRLYGLGRNNVPVVEPVMVNICMGVRVWVKVKVFGFIVLYPPKRSHDLPPLAGLYTRKPFQSPGGYFRAVGSIKRTSSKHCLINARYPFCSWVD